MNADPALPLPLLLVPGTLCDERLWQGQRSALAAQRPVQVIDWRDERDIAALAARILADAPPRFAIAGMSMGGSIALEVCAQDARRVAGLALIDAHPWADPSGRADARRMQAQFARVHGLAALVQEQLWPHYVHGSRRADARLLALIQDMAVTCGVATFERQIELLSSRVDRLETLAALNVPVLIAAGADDALVPWQWQEAMCDRARNSTCEVIAGCGHFAVLEDPGRVLALMLGWLSNCTGIDLPT